jgi:iron(III) transport system ATP-binding protein
MRAQVREILAAAGATAVLVTHDQEEALSIADRVAVMRTGRVLQVDTPAALYAHPVDPFVAAFVGDADVLPGRLDGGAVDTALGVLAAANAGAAGPVSVVVRPEQVHLTLDAAGGARVHQIEYFGHDQLVTVGVAGGQRVRARLGSAHVLAPGDLVSVAVTGTVLTYPEPQPDRAAVTAN